jgi:hypothetical protein
MQWQMNRKPALRAEVNHQQRTVTLQLKVSRNDHWNATVKSLDPEEQSMMVMTKLDINVPFSPPGNSGGVTLSDL